MRNSYNSCRTCLLSLLRSVFKFKHVQKKPIGYASILNIGLATCPASDLSGDQEPPPLGLVFWGGRSELGPPDQAGHCRPCPQWSCICSFLRSKDQRARLTICILGKHIKNPYIQDPIRNRTAFIYKMNWLIFLPCFALQENLEAYLRALNSPRRWPG